MAYLCVYIFKYVPKYIYISVIYILLYKHICVYRFKAAHMLAHKHTDTHKYSYIYMYV